MRRINSAAAWGLAAVLAAGAGGASAQNDPCTTPWGEPLVPFPGAIDPGPFDLAPFGPPAAAVVHEGLLVLASRPLVSSEDLSRVAVRTFDGVSWADDSYPPIGLAGPDTQNAIHALCSLPSGLFALGAYDTGLVQEATLWRWETAPADWRVFGFGSLAGGAASFRTATFFDDDVLVGGEFDAVRRPSTTEAEPAENIAGFDAFSAGFAFGSADGPVLALASYQDAPVMAGDYTVAAGFATNNLAVWNGFWDTMAGGSDGPVSALAPMGDDLVAVGDFMVVGGVIAPGAAVWDGTAWAALSKTPIAGADHAVEHEGVLYVSGPISIGAEPAALGVAALVDGDWVRVGTFEQNAGDAIADLVSYGGELYALGRFTVVDGPSDVARLLCTPAGGGGTDCQADLTGDGQVDSGDLELFINAFLAQGSIADLTQDGQVDSGDLELFIQLFLAGC
jgi:hypothetical protein